MEYEWKFKPAGDKAAVNHLSEVLNIDPSLCNLLVQRGTTTFQQAKRFFRPQLTDLYDPFLMQDMDKAVLRLEQAITRDEKILVYGDYDVDGTTSVALVYSFIKQFYPNVDYYIPDRYTEGYGVSYKGIEYARDSKAALIIALDCGIKAVDKVEYARQHHVDFIICDHHTPGDSLPEAVAVLDPKRADCNYPFKELSGCGVGFKLLQAFSLRNNIPFEQLSPFLDLVAVSIASDIVPIVDENRILAYYGLRQINAAPCVGLKSIIDIAGAADKELTISDIVFKIGPRINAAGRIKSGRKAVELLIATTEDEAKAFGEAINEFNITRKNYDHNITQEALQMIAANDDMKTRKTTVLFQPHWHKGVIGIVASRLIESYYRPTIVLTESHGMATGSARSVTDYNLYDAIDSCSDLLESFGGHKYAAGLTLKLENVPEFTERFERFVNQTITDEILRPQIEIDARICLQDITPKFFRILRQFAPFGPGNMSPVFVTDNVSDYGSRIVGAKGEHLRCEVKREHVIISGIGFSLAHYFDRIQQHNKFHICYSIQENEFRGKKSLQLMVKDLKFGDY